MRVLVTGATGYIGRAVMAALNTASIPAVTAGRRPFDGVPFIETDLLRENDFDGLVHRAGATHLMHLAWEAGHGGYWSHPDNPRWAIATVRLVESFCRGGGKGIVVAGSSAEYDWTYGWCQEDLTPSAPRTPYGIAKDAARRLSHDVAKRAEVPLAWGRIFLSFGSGEDSRRLIPSLIAALRGERPPFSMDDSAFRDFLHVSDTASALVRLLTQGADGVVNVSSGLPSRLRDIVRLLAQEMGADPAPLLALGAERPGDPRLIVGDPARLKAFGWQPRLTLAEGLNLVLRSPT